MRRRRFPKSFSGIAGRGSETLRARRRGFSDVSPRIPGRAAEDFASRRGQDDGDFRDLSRKSQDMRRKILRRALDERARGRGRSGRSGTAIAIVYYDFFSAVSGRGEKKTNFKGVRVTHISTGTATAKGGQIIAPLLKNFACGYVDNSSFFIESFSRPALFVFFLFRWYRQLVGAMPPPTASTTDHKESLF